jgi:hypothetical protein
VAVANANWRRAVPPWHFLGLATPSQHKFPVQWEPCWFTLGGLNTETRADDGVFAVGKEGARKGGRFNEARAEIGLDCGCALMTLNTSQAEPSFGLHPRLRPHNPANLLIPIFSSSRAEVFPVNA